MSKLDENQRLWTYRTLRTSDRAHKSRAAAGCACADLADLQRVIIYLFQFIYLHRFIRNIHEIIVISILFCHSLGLL